jgi:ADP-ribosylglycohydrolase
MGREERLLGLMLGTAVGDSLGLPAEGMSRTRVARRFRGQWKQRFLPGRGMISDDTEHTIFVAQALLQSGGDVNLFARRLAFSLRWWILALPAGIGFGTLRAIFKLWLGYGPARAGVFTAGNGPSMRVAPIGAFFADAPEKLEEFVAASTTLTHTDPKALVGARAVAHCVARVMRTGDIPPFDEEARRLLTEVGRGDELWEQQVEHLERGLARGEPVAEFADHLVLARGITGFTHHTVPMALYAWWRHPADFEAGLCALLDCGGDTDTVGAIYGALAGATVGERGIPAHWTDGVRDWPRGVPTLRRLTRALEESRRGAARPPVSYFVPGVLPRNAFFLLVVLLHGLRRLFPG